MRKYPFIGFFEYLRKHLLFLPQQNFIIFHVFCSLALVSEVDFPQFNSISSMKEMLDYYATGPASEIDSSARFDFDIWNLIENWRRILGIAGNRLLDIGGGLGKFSAMAIRRGFDVTMVDISRDIIQRAVALHPELKNRVYILDIFNPQNVTDFIRKHGQFDIILSLGFVVNHTDSPEKILCALDNHLKLAKANSLLVIDIEIGEIGPFLHGVISGAHYYH